MKSIGRLFLVLAILCGGCARRPKEVLSERKLVNLMADLQLAEAYSNTTDMGRYNSEDRENLGKGVLSQHGITQEQLDTTLAWYGRNIDDYTELYEKVDKEIVSRRKKIMKVDKSLNEVNSSDMLWPYTSHGVISDLGNTDAWIFSIESPQLERGDVVEWSMRMSETVPFNGVLGVEYADGTADALSQMLTGSRKYEMRLQTDTGKHVSRIYGTIRIKEESRKPVYSDSIMLRRIPYDSLEYGRHRNLRHYGVPVRIMPKVEKKDSLPADTLKKEILPTVENRRIEIEKPLRPGQSKVESNSTPDRLRKMEPNKRPLKVEKTKR